MKPLFIEIGVSNFQTLENLLHVGWQGIMVEPIKDLLNQISDHPNLYKESVALDVKDGFASFWMIRNPNEWINPQEVVGMSSLVDSPGPLYQPEYENRKKVIQVQTMRLDTLLSKHKVSQIDFLKIDIEGKDVEILLDYSFNIKPKMIKFEHVHYSGLVYDASVAGFDQEEMSRKFNILLERLKQMGYVVWVEQEDVYCLR